MITRDDVARAARVSSATVSRAFNDPDSVSPARVKRVMDAASRLGYTPDKNASALRRSGAGTILLLEKSRGPAVDNDERFYRWFYADIIRSVKSAVDESMLQLALHSYTSVVDIRAIGKRRLADGIVCHGMVDEAEVAAVRGLGIPYVICRQMDATQPGVNISFVDEFSGGAIAARTLVDAGHRRPCHITGSLAHVPVCGARWEGFASAFPGVRPELIDGDLGIAGGHASAMKATSLIKSGGIDCIFVVNDLTAVGVVQALLASGIRIPGDISVIGYDNLPFIGTLPVSLTTIDIQMGRTYREGTDLLLKSMKTGAVIHNPVTPTLVPGGTVAMRNR
jgi:LacI family transcriptional regulator